MIAPPPPPLRAPAATATEQPRALVRVPAPDLARRAQLERTRGRLVVAAAGFGLLFLGVAVKLTVATVLDPLTPKPRVEIGRAHV